MRERNDERKVAEMEAEAPLRSIKNLRGTILPAAPNSLAGVLAFSESSVARAHSFLVAFNNFERKKSAVND